VCCRRGSRESPTPTEIDNGANKSPSAFIEALHIIHGYLQPGQYLLAADVSSTQPEAKRPGIDEGHKTAASTGQRLAID
jgi:hypothetical protein